jgi:hypothetical protein
VTRADLHADLARDLRALAATYAPLAALAGDKHCLDAVLADLARAARVEESRALAWRRAEGQVARAEALELARESERRAPAPF